MGKEAKTTDTLDEKGTYRVQPGTGDTCLDYER